MGYDEHGPAYPEPPDPHPVWDKPDWQRRDPYRDTSPNVARSLAGWACFLALLVYLIWPHAL